MGKIRPPWTTYYGYLDRQKAAGFVDEDLLIKLMQRFALPRWYADEVIYHWLRRRRRTT